MTKRKTTEARRKKIVAALTAAVDAGKTNRYQAAYLARKALAMLPDDGQLDMKLVAKVMRLGFVESETQIGMELAGPDHR